MNGTTLRKRRQELGLTQQQLASNLISPTYLSRIERGRARPTKRLMQALNEQLKKCEEDYYSPGSNGHVIDVLVQMALNFARFGPLNESLPLIERAMELARESERPLVKCRVLAVQAYITHQRGFKPDFWDLFIQLEKENPAEADTDDAWRWIETIHLIHPLVQDHPSAFQIALWIRSSELVTH